MRLAHFETKFRSYLEQVSVFFSTNEVTLRATICSARSSRGPSSTCCARDLYWEQKMASMRAMQWRKLPVSLTELCIDTTLRCGQSFRCDSKNKIVSLAHALLMYLDGGNPLMMYGRALSKGAYFPYDKTPPISIIMQHIHLAPTPPRLLPPQHQLLPPSF